MKYVIVGNSAAGVNAAETIRELDQDNEIVIISEEEGPFYSRCLTSYYIARDIEAEDMVLRSDEFYNDLNIEGRFGTKVREVNPETKDLVLDTEETVTFDKLLIATGGSPVKPGIEGSDTEGVFTLRTYEDAERIVEKTAEANKAVVVGGGFVGMKAATALNKRGLDVEVVELEDKLLGHMIDEPTNKIIENKLKKNGIKVTTDQSVAEVKSNNGVESVILENGSELECDLVIISVGVTPNTELVAETDIEVNEGIVVNNKMLTNYGDIYAAGDVVEAYDVVEKENKVNALWPLAVKQGKVAGANMAGQDCKYDGGTPMNAIDFFGLFVISVGITEPEGNYEILAENKEDDRYRKLVLKDNVLKGAIYIDQVEKAGIARSLIENEVDLTNYKDALLADDFSFYKSIK